MKKNILFAIDSLHCAGAEKSLVTLLSLLDYSKYNVDLMLFGHGGVLEEILPKEVNLLKPLKYTEFCNMSISNAIKYSLEQKNLKMLSSRLKFSMKIRGKKHTNGEKARIYWKNSRTLIEENSKKYDIAISYAQGVPTFYVAEKIIADKKLAWVNAIYDLKGKDKIFQRPYYSQFDKIISVSHVAKDIFEETYPEFKEKLDVIYDISDAELIYKMSNLDKSYNDNFDGIKILTIGRLASQKGYDMALEACKILRDKGINFRWYVLGKGPLKDDIEKYIKENELQDYFKLLGVKSNPYPYIKDADIYVQTSRFEGFGLAIAEARMLNTPVVTTEFNAVYNQMVQGKNGLVVDMDSESIANGILKLINDEVLRNSIVEYLKIEKKGNTEELEKFYELIG